MRKDDPLEGTRIVEVKLGTCTGKTVILREKVAISSRVQQPILCFCRLLGQGFGIDGTSQTLVHPASKTEIPLQLQNRSMVVMGHVRVLSAEPFENIPEAVRAARADVTESLVQSPIGWTGNTFGYIVGRHLSGYFQDPTLAFPALQGPQCRTTLVKADDSKWCVLELDEPLGMIIQLDAPFHELEGQRSVITIVTTGEKQPALMGFNFEEDAPLNEHAEWFGDDPGDAFTCA